LIAIPASCRRCRPTIRRPDPATPVSIHHGMVVRLRNYFLTGLVLVGPAYITISLTWWFINWVDDLVRPFIPIAYRPDTYLPVKIPGTGLIIALTALTLLGFLTANFVGRKLVESGENILNRMPVVRPIYKSLKQIFETLFATAARASAGSVWSSFLHPACGRWYFYRIRRAPTWRRGCRLPSTSRLSCRARPIRPPAFFFYVPRRDVSISTSRSKRDDAADVGWHGAAGRATSRRSWPPSPRLRASRSRAIEPHRCPRRSDLSLPGST
jgi:hypothetical protein